MVSQNNFITNGTAPQHNPELIGIDFDSDNGTFSFPYGAQFQYPCGGTRMSSNRTTWPITGGAVAVQPGWFPGHKEAFFYINLGYTKPGELAPANYSHPMVEPFNIVGPDNEQYDGTFCLPQVPMPSDLPPFKVGDNVTLQVIEVTKHGASLYNCVDLTLANVEDVPEVNSSNCFNSSDLQFQLVFSTKGLTAAATAVDPPGLWFTASLLGAVLAMVGLWM